jgi:hypothetical protein
VVVTSIDEIKQYMNALNERLWCKSEGGNTTSAQHASIVIEEAGQGRHGMSRLDSDTSGKSRKNLSSLADLLP